MPLNALLLEIKVCGAGKWTRSQNVHTHTYICVCVCMYVYVYIYICPALAVSSSWFHGHILQSHRASLSVTMKENDSCCLWLTRSLTGEEHVGKSKQLYSSSVFKVIALPPNDAEWIKVSVWHFSLFKIILNKLTVKNKPTAHSHIHGIVELKSRRAFRIYPLNRKKEQQQDEM